MLSLWNQCIWLWNGSSVKVYIKRKKVIFYLTFERKYVLHWWLYWRTVYPMYFFMKHMSFSTYKFDNFNEGRKISCLFYCILMKCQIQYFIYPKENLLIGFIMQWLGFRKSDITKTKPSVYTDLYYDRFLIHNEYDDD